MQLTNYCNYVVYIHQYMYKCVKDLNWTSVHRKKILVNTEHLLIWLPSLFWIIVQVSHVLLIQLIKISVKNSCIGAPGWLSGLGLCLRLGSWSQDPGIEPLIGLSLSGEPASPSLSACLSAYMWSLSLSQINK